MGYDLLLPNVFYIKLISPSSNSTLKITFAFNAPKILKLLSSEINTLSCNLHSQIQNMLYQAKACQVSKFAFRARRHQVWQHHLSQLHNQ